MKKAETKKVKVSDELRRTVANTTASSSNQAKRTLGGGKVARPHIGRKEK